MNFIEILLFILAGQYIHVLHKLIGAANQFGDAFKLGAFFKNKKTKLSLILNGSLILVFSVMLTKAGFGESMGSAIATAKPLPLFGLDVPAKLWIGLFSYSAFLTLGYFAQSAFYWVVRGGLKKANIEIADDEKVGP
jgi:hypothetical protein